MKLIIIHKRKKLRHEAEVNRFDEIERLIKRFCRVYKVRTCEVEFKGKAKLQDKQKHSGMDCLFG